jgi:hypothetical protein
VRLAICPQCGLCFTVERGAAAVCPSCRAVDAQHKECWRCKRQFVPLDPEGITCEDCKTFWAVCSAPSLRRI